MIIALTQATVAMLAVIAVALACCTLGLWAVLGEHDLRSPVPRRQNRVAGMSPDALALVRQANRRRWMPHVPSPAGEAPRSRTTPPLR